MLRRLGKNILLISIPLFIILLITFRNHDHLVKRETQTNEPSEEAEVGQWATARQPIPVERSERQLSEQWRVLRDGTVIHRGKEDLNRNYTLLLNNPSQCATLRTNQTSFVIVVESDIVNFEARQVIRDTYGLNMLQSIANYRVIFLVGLSHNPQVQNKLEFENHIYEDIVQIDIYEDFQNLTYKSIHMLNWYTKFCANAKFLFKTDDDIFLHIPNMMALFDKVTLNGSILCHANKSRKILRSLSDIHSFVYSFKEKNKKLIRNKFHKYLISFDKLPGLYYPEYCSGFGYAMNYEVALRLLNASSVIPYFGIEDVFITGFCREAAVGNITIVSNAHFQLKPLIQPIESKCAFENGRITSNEVSVDSMRKLWTHLNTQGYYCKMTNTNQ